MQTKYGDARWAELRGARAALSKALPKVLEGTAQTAREEELAGLFVEAFDEAKHWRDAFEAQRALYADEPLKQLSDAACLLRDAAQLLRGDDEAARTLASRLAYALAPFAALPLQSGEDMKGADGEYAVSCEIARRHITTARAVLVDFDAVTRRVFVGKAADDVE